MEKREIIKDVAVAAGLVIAFVFYFILLGA